MVVTCEIEFDNNPFGIYFAGQIMTGKITLQADMPKQVKGIVLKITGDANTSWEEHSNRSTTDAHGRSSTESHTTYYRGHEDYIKSKTYLLSSSENQSSVIEPGIHTYTFACQLPPTCPSSFEGHYGYIRYLVKVELVRPWKFNQHFTRGFTVLKVMDLNYDSPLLRVPCKSEAQKVFCCWPCKTQPLKMHVSLPQSGYVPGQAIPVSVLIANESNIKVEELKIELVMLVCYYSQVPLTHTKNERIAVLKLKGDGVSVHCKKQFNYTLVVPATPPTCFNLCRIIQIAYQVEVVAKVKGWHADQVICVPVTIGNVPLLGVIQNQPLASAENLVPSNSINGVMNHSYVADEESGDIGEKKFTEIDQLQSTVQENPIQVNSGAATSTATMAAAPPSPWAADASIPPPSYEAALHMKPAKLSIDEGQEYGETEFAPRYPVFKIPSASGRDEVDAEPKIDDVATNGVVPPEKSTWL
ncbi:arrestin domain-containing protein 17 [Bactrocera oleae]|uniref:arrestin domain-containing protein 17 n=1 Tax=Bactrocera oleae TaxID=104688 RepID=UPI00387ECC15